MNKERKILLVILLFSILFSLSTFNIFWLTGRRERAQARIDVLEKQYIRLTNKGLTVPEGTLELWESCMEEERDRFFTKEEKDPYKLGIEILAMLENQGIQVMQYKTLEVEDGFLLEFSLEARTSSFFNFWQTLYKKEKYYSIPYFTLKNEKKGISSTFRIGYALYE